MNINEPTAILELGLGSGNERQEEGENDPRQVVLIEMDLESSRQALGEFASLQWDGWISSELPPLISTSAYLSSLGSHSDLPSWCLLSSSSSTEQLNALQKAINQMV